MNSPSIYNRNNLPENPPVFSGYITVPFDKEREAWVRFCYETNTVCIITNDNKFVKDVRVSKNIIHEIEFPDAQGGFGSYVVVVNTSIYDTPHIAGIFNKIDELGQIESERTFRHFKLSKDGTKYVDITGKADTGELDITVNTGDSAAESNINVLSKNKDSKLKIYVQGDVEITSDKKTTINSTTALEFNVYKPNKSKKKTSISYTAETGLNYTDEFGNVITIQEGEITIDSKKINLGHSNYEKAVLGETLAKLLNKILDEVSNITTATAIGTQPILNKVNVMTLKLEVDNILSAVNKLQ
jgi:hypothetical protein